MAKKIALLIGVSDYGAGLKSLRCPTNGVSAMQEVLSHADIGGFDEVIPLLNPDVGEMRSRISEVFSRLTKQDLILFYFTGHGIKDMTGDFYLTTAQSELFESGRPNAGTAVEADFLKREISNAAAMRKVIILDCCFGAAFADGFLTMGETASVDIEAQLGGRGWCVLTASTSNRYALEQVDEPLSVYTRYLVEGLKTGGAAPDGEAVISARHLHEYVKAQVKVAAPMMEPAIFNGQQGYDIAIAKALMNPERRYRQQVQAKADKGEIGPAGKAVLVEWQRRLGLTPEQAEVIEADVLQPYRERRQNLKVYREAIAAEKTAAYPLSEATLQDLKDLQRLLGLRDIDVAAIEQQTLGHQAHADGQPEIKACVKQPTKNNREQFKQQPEKQPACSLKVTQSRIKTVSVNRKGEIVETPFHEVTTFTESLGRGVTLEMIKIPKGTFVMGTAKGEEGAAQTEPAKREVAIAEFWMGRHVVTRSQWQTAAIQPAQQPAQISNEVPPHPFTPSPPLTSPHHPIENIFWTDAVAYCQWLSRQTGRDYRLPTAAQWEYACRARTTTPFHFGETLTPELANYNGGYAYGDGPRGKYRQQTTAVGSFYPNAFGLHDMHGNVWEWCLDGWPNRFSQEASSGSAWQLSGQKKCLRGGSWSYLPTNCRSAYQLEYPFHNRIDDIGFRVICVNPSFS